MTMFAPIYYPYLAISDSCMRMHFLNRVGWLVFWDKFWILGWLVFWNEGSTQSTGGNHPGSVNIVPVVKNSFCTNTNSALVPVVKVKKTNKMFLRSNIICVLTVLVTISCYYHQLLTKIRRFWKPLVGTRISTGRVVLCIYICN